MSFKGFSKAFKKSFNKNLNRLAFRLDDGLTNRKTVWHVLITGGSGHLAQKLVHKLVEHVRDELRLDVVASLGSHKEVPPCGERHRKRLLMQRIEVEISRRMSSFFKVVLLDLIEPNNELLKNDYTSYVCGSFTDYEIMKNVLVNVDTVFHLAAVGMTGLFATDRKACMDINAVGTMNLLSWCRQNGVSRFIYTSSVGVVFSGEPLNNASEDLEHPHKFYNYYCESKAHAEKIVQHASCPELKTTVLRFNGIYGPGERRVTKRVVNFMLSGWWIGTCKPNGVEAQTQLSSVDNCVQGLIKAEIALRRPDCKDAQIYNIMDGTPYGTFTFWTPLNKALGFTDAMINIPPSVLRAGGWLCQTVANYFKVDPLMTSLEVDLLTVNNTFSIEKARQEIGYEPYPNSMPEIVEMYQVDIQSPAFIAQRKQMFISKMVILCVLGIVLIIFSGVFVYMFSTYVYYYLCTFFTFLQLIFHYLSQ